MTKVCPNCKAENPDSAGFCQDCGEELKSTVSQNGKEHIIIPPKGERVNTPQKDKEGKGISGWWSKQSSGGKAALGIVGVCCLGLILIVAIGGMFSPDKTTTGTNTTAVAAEQNTTQYRQNLIDLQDNPKAYVGKNVVIVGSRGISTKHDSTSYGSLEGTEIMMGDSDKVGSSHISIWYTGPPINLDLGGDIKVNGTFVKNSDWKYGLSDYVIITDKIEVV